jgi:hypothetical protein
VSAACFSPGERGANETSTVHKRSGLRLAPAQSLRCENSDAAAPTSCTPSIVTASAPAFRTITRTGPAVEPTGTPPKAPLPTSWICSGTGGSRSPRIDRSVGTTSAGKRPTSGPSREVTPASRLETE